MFSHEHISIFETGNLNFAHYYGLRNVEIVLTEGRNRQIRKMAEALGLAVVNLHRTTFAGISLKGLSEGNWAEFSEKDMQIVQEALAASNSSGKSNRFIYSSPPTQLHISPSCSAIVSRTSSSSSKDSQMKGINSSLVLSGPNAWAEEQCNSQFE